MPLPDIRLVVSDIDGVWTDGSMYYDRFGNELKRFNTSDSAGVLFCRLNDWPVAIMTGEDTEIVTRRAEKLRLEHVFLGVHDKRAQAARLCEALGLTLAQVAFLGNDLNDIPLLRACGYAGTVPEAPAYVRRYADYVTTTPGGSGAFRDFVEHLLTQRGLLDATVEAFLQRYDDDAPAPGGLG